MSIKRECEQRSFLSETLNLAWMLSAALLATIIAPRAVNSAPTLAPTIAPALYGATFALAFAQVNGAGIFKEEGRQTSLDYDQLINIFYEVGEGEDSENFYEYNSAGGDEEEEDVEKVFEEEEEGDEKKFAPTSLSTPPSTSFSCAGRTPGAYYADPEAGCQLFHRCVVVAGRFFQFPFLCPNGTVFSEQLATCNWWWMVDCPPLAVAPEATSNNFNIEDLSLLDLTFNARVQVDPRGRDISSVGLKQEIQASFPAYSGQSHTFTTIIFDPTSITIDQLSNSIGPKSNSIDSNSRIETSSARGYEIIITIF